MWPSHLWFYKDSHQSRHKFKQTRKLELTSSCQSERHGNNHDMPVTVKVEEIPFSRRGELTEVNYTSTRARTPCLPPWRGRLHQWRGRPLEGRGSWTRQWKWAQLCVFWAACRSSLTNSKRQSKPINRAAAALISLPSFHSCPRPFIPPPHSIINHKNTNI